MTKNVTFRINSIINVQNFRERQMIKFSKLRKNESENRPPQTLAAGGEVPADKYLRKFPKIEPKIDSQMEMKK